jgi:hypothetical protein
MERNPEMNILAPLYHGVIVNILNSQMNYIEDEIINEPINLMPIEVLNLQEEKELLEDIFVPGEFLYVADIKERAKLQDCWRAINKLNLWEFMKLDIDNYTWSNKSEVLAIIDNLSYNEYYGMSFEWAMRDLQYIARFGEVNYQSTIEKNGY